MPNSDVVIGWVTAGGETMFHVRTNFGLYTHNIPALQDRYAEGRFSPAVDEQQDWMLEFGEEDENGFTILGFSRDFITCDDKDLPISVNH